VKRIHFIIDIRRHRGDSNFIIGLINRFMAGQPVVAVEWLVRPDQAASLPPQSVIGQADSNDRSWATGIATRIRQLSQSGQEGLEIMVLSYDGYLLNGAERLVYSDNLPVKTKHLSELIKNHCCPVKSRIESVGCPDRADQTGSPVAEVPVKWAFFQKATG
jgi:hypothetical protein